ncbi:Trk system potassium transporter TrkA [Peptoniphilaceae bacterium SGI.131]
MKILIAGAGKVGEVLCSDLSKEDHDITLIEQDEAKFQKMLHSYDINVILGNCAYHQILSEAGVESSDLFLSVTTNDELNMIASILAKRMGAKKTIARVRNPEYLGLSAIMKSSLDINFLINPELEAAKRIVELLEFPLADSFESFAENKAPIVELKVTKNFSLLGKSLVDFRNMYKNLIICTVLREGTIYIPKGDTNLEENDHLFVTGPMDELIKLYKDNGQDNNKIKSIFIIGGGLLAQYVIRQFRKGLKKIKVLEINPHKADSLSRMFPDIDVIEADGTNIENLLEQGAANYDAVLALTGIDEENIITSMIAKKLGVKKTVTKINRTELLDIVDSVGLQSIITPKRIIADKMIQYVRALDNSQGSSLEALYTIAHEQVEAIQFRVREGSKLTLKPIKDLKLKDHVLIVYIYRDGKVIFPRGNDQVQVGDKLVVISNCERLRDLDEIVQ